MNDSVLSRMRRARLGGRLPTLLISVTLWACYPESPTDIDEIDIVVTAVDESFDFAGALTYAMPDSVVEIDIGGGAAGSYDQSLSAGILARVASNMAAAGYVRELNPVANGADVAVIVQASVTLNIDAYSYYAWDPYWGWYPGWDYWGGCPGCGWGYPPATTIVSYRTGSIIIQMVDPTATETTDDGPAWNVRWIAILNGLAEGSNIAGRIDTAIDQAFTQSAYLGS